MKPFGKLINRFAGLTVEEVRAEITILNEEEKGQLLFLYHNYPSGVFSDNLLVALSQWEYENAAANTIPKDHIKVTYRYPWNEGSKVSVHKVYQGIMLPVGDK